MVRRGDARDHVGDPGPVLADTEAGLAGDPRIAVGHVCRRLLVPNRDEANPGRGEEIQYVHIGGADDAENLGDPLRP